MADNFPLVSSGRVITAEELDQVHGRAWEDVDVSTDMHVFVGTGAEANFLKSTKCNRAKRLRYSYTYQTFKNLLSMSRFLSIRPFKFNLVRLLSPSVKERTLPVHSAHSPFARLAS